MVSVVGSVDCKARQGAYFIFDIILSQRLNRCMACIVHDGPPLKSENQQLRIVRLEINIIIFCLLKLTGIQHILTHVENLEIILSIFNMRHENMIIAASGRMRHGGKQIKAFVSQGLKRSE